MVPVGSTNRDQRVLVFFFFFDLIAGFRVYICRGLVIARFPCPVVSLVSLPVTVTLPVAMTVTVTVAVTVTVTAVTVTVTVTFSTS